MICNELMFTTVHEILAKYTCSEYLQVGKQIFFTFQVVFSEVTFAYKTFLSNIFAIIAGHDENKRTMIYCLKLCQKCLYLASLLFVFAALFAAIYQGVKRFLDYPTYTETAIVSQQHASFPAISFCATPNDYKEDVLKVN